MPSTVNTDAPAEGLTGKGYVAPLEVVVVDDDELMLESLVMVLQEEGFRVRSATGGADALALVDALPPDILVSDVRMEGMDGIETIRRAREKVPEIVGIVVTGFAEADTPLKAIRVGVDDYLSKPFELEAFVHAVRRNAEKVVLRKQLHEAEKFSALGKMAAGIAHEIRNPLQAIQNAVALLKSKPSGDLERTLKLIHIAEEETVRVNAIVEGVMSLARMKEPRPARMDAKVLAEESAQRFSLAGLPAKKDLCITVEGDTLETFVDPMQFQQIVQNLLQNAAQASPSGATVTVTVQRRAPMVAVSVTDQGPGVDPGDRDRVFELFYTTRHDGTGIGLALCRHMARLHGGDLVLEAGDAAGGARFTLLLPEAH